MVSFACESCNDVIPKKKLDQHRNQCRWATFTCLDCSTTFQGTDYRSHTSCISEAQKYQGHLYREKDKKGKAEKRKSLHYDNSQAMVPQKAYVEDAPDGEDSQAVAIVDVPPRAPTPPPAAELPESVNVFDFLVREVTPKDAKRTVHAPDERHMLEQAYHYGNGDSQYSQFSTDGSQYMHNGFSYGNAPVNPSMARYDSSNFLDDSQQSQSLMPPPPFVTPASKEHRKEKRDRNTTEKSDKKRKRQQVEELDLSSVKRPSSRDASSLTAPPHGSGGRVLHSGLTGGLNKLVTDPEFYNDRIDAGPTPILSPIKRSKRDEDVKKDRRKSSYASYSTTTSKPASSKHSDDRHHRPRSVEREYHDDKHRRPASVVYSHDDNKNKHRRHRESVSTTSDDRPQRKHLKAIDYDNRYERPASVQPGAHNQIVSYASRADLFMSLVNKGPGSEHGCSINKVLKRYHRERDVRGESKEEEDKELWKSLRLRRNDRGEIVLFL